MLLLGNLLNKVFQMNFHQTIFDKYIGFWYVWDINSRSVVSALNYRLNLVSDRILIGFLHYAAMLIGC